MCCRRRDKMPRKLTHADLKVGTKFKWVAMIDQPILTIELDKKERGYNCYPRFVCIDAADGRGFDFTEQELLQECELYEGNDNA
jgi:hypothetical protein